MHMAFVFSAVFLGVLDRIVMGWGRGGVPH
jgi:hypothetical protein